MSETKNFDAYSQDLFNEKQVDKYENFQELFGIEDSKVNLQSSSLKNTALQIQARQNIIRQYQQLLHSPQIIKPNNEHYNHNDIQYHLPHNSPNIIRTQKSKQSQQHINHKLKDLFNKLSSHNFFLLKAQNSQTHPHEIQKKILQKHQNYGIFQIFCQIGRFSKKYIVLNAKVESFRHCYNRMGYGSFGDVYGSKSFKGQKIAIKCLKFQQNQIGEAFKNFITEFMIADIMSAAEIGPKILRRSGFDFILFPRCMEFEMEICSQIKLQTLNSDLKENLQKMHLLKIVHSDIKPNNIMFSEYLNKNVFIDFGIAEVLSSQLWEKTETRFKGTYEFAGQEMKKVLMNKRLSKINLYLNDVQMLLNSIKKISRQRYSPQQMKQNYNKRKHDIQFQNQDLEMEMLIRLKYHMYCFQRTNIVTPELDNFLKELTILMYQRQELSFLKRQISSFLDNLKVSSKEIIISNMIIQRNNDSKMYNILHRLLFNQQQPFQTNFQSHQSKMKSSQIDSVEFLFQNLQDQQKFSKQSLHSKFLHLNKKGVYENLRFILGHTAEIFKFSTEEYFQLLLEFTSFWKGSVKVSIEEKQKAAAIMRSLFENQINSKSSGIKYLEPIYLPKEAFVNKNCQNLIWVYGWLLSYCMSGQFNGFKSKNLMTIVKDCIFLSFQYDLFIPECLQKYIHFVIEESAHMIVTLTMIQCFEIYSLASRHFLIETSRLKPNRQKTFRMMKNVLQECNRYAHQFYQSQTKEALAQRNCKAFLQISWMLKNRFYNELNFKVNQKATTQNCLYKNIRNLVLLIEQQFSRNNDLQKVAIFQKSKRLIYFSFLDVFENEIDSMKSSLFPSFHRFNSLQKEFDVLKLFQMDTKVIEKIEENLFYIEEKINCQDISMFFTLPFVFIRSFKKKDNQGMEKVLKIVFTNFASSLLNLNIVMKIAQEKEKFFRFVITNNSFFYVKQKRKVIFKVMQFLSENPVRYVKQILFCANILTNFDFLDLEHNQITSQDIENQIRLFQSVFSKFYLKIGINSITLFVGFHILNHLKLKKEMYEKYLDFRLEFFRMMYQQMKHKEKQQIFIKGDKQMFGKLHRLFGNKMPISVDEIENYKRMINFHNQTDEINIIKEDFCKNSIFNISGLSNNYEERSTKFCEIYFKIKKLKILLVQHYKLSQFAGDAIQFFLYNSNFNEIFEIFTQFAIQIYTNKTPKQYNLLVHNFASVKIELPPNQKTKFVGQFINYLFNIQTIIKRVMDPVVLFPLYMEILNYEQYLYSKKQIHKKILIKVLIFFEKFLVVNFNLCNHKKNQFQDYNIKKELYQKVMHFSMRYVDRWKGERKRRILQRQLIKSLVQINPEFIKYLNKLFKKGLKPNQQQALKKQIFYERIQKYSTPKDKVFMTDSCHQLKERAIEVEKEQKYKRLNEQTIKIRKKLMDLQFKMLCEILEQRYKKSYEQVSWIIQLNSLKGFSKFKIMPKQSSSEINYNEKNSH